MSCDEESNGGGEELGEGSNSGYRNGVKRRFDPSWVELALNLDSVGRGSEGEGRRGKKIRGFEQSDDVAEDSLNKSIGSLVIGIENLGFLDKKGENNSFNGNIHVDEVGANGELGNKVVLKEIDTWMNWDLGHIVDDGNQKGNLGKFEKLGLYTGDDGGRFCDGLDDLFPKWQFVLNEPSWYPENEVIRINEGGLRLDERMDEEARRAEDLIKYQEAANDYAARQNGGRFCDGLDDLFPKWQFVLNEPSWYPENEVIRIIEGGLRLDERMDEEARRAEDLIKYQEAANDYAARQKAENAMRFREVAKDYAAQLALDHSQSQEHLKLPSSKTSMKLEDLPGPFSSALKAVREQSSRCNTQQLNEWKPLKDQNSKILMPIAPSLLDLSLRALTKNSETIVSLDHVPDWLRQRLSTMLCDARKMDCHVLNLLLRGSPAEIRVKDCSWITDAQASMLFGKLDAKNLKVLQLDLFGKCAIDDILNNYLAKSPNSLMCLHIVSLRGACRLSDDLLKSLVTSAPLLQSVNIGQLPLITGKGIKFLADSLAPCLRELYIDDCENIDATHIMTLVTKFQHLEVLSVAGIESVCDAFVTYIITRIGGNIKELNMANCGKITDRSLEVIGKHCPDLQSLNISNLDSLTDFGLLYLANGCRSVQTLKCCRNKFSDDAIAAFLNASGQSLMDLSLNGVSKVGTRTAMALAKYPRNLSSLDLSWCRRISNEELGLVVDSCLALKQLKIFGCTQITDIFLKGHSNPLVHIVGTNLTPLLKHVNSFKFEEVLLRYSPF